MIEVTALTRTYGGLRAVDDVTFTAQPGRVTGFLGPERRRQVDDHARHGRADPADLRVGHRPRPSVRRPAQPRPRGRRPPRRLRPARRPHRPRDPPDRRPHDGPAACRGSTRCSTLVSLTADRGRAPGQELLARHAPAARHRHRADRRPRGADPRRAGQRPRPGRHPLDARPAHAASRTRAAPCCSPRTCCTRSRSSPTTWSSSARAGSWPRAPRPSCWPSAGTLVRSSAITELATALEQNGIHAVASGQDALRAEAEADQVGKVALAAGVPLSELRAADGAGLEEMFLELTADTVPRRSSSMTTPPSPRAHRPRAPAARRPAPRPRPIPFTPAPRVELDQDVRHPRRASG